MDELPAPVLILFGLIALAFLVRIWIWWSGEIKKPFQKQALVQLTDKTPRQVCMSSARVFIVGVLLVASIIVLAYEYPEKAYRLVLTLLKQMIRALQWTINVLRAIVNALE